MTEDIGIWILLLLVFLLAALVYKLYNNKKRLIETCRSFAEKIVQKYDYLLLRVDEVEYLPAPVIQSASELVKESTSSAFSDLLPYTVNIPDTRMLFLLSNKKIIGMLRLIFHGNSYVPEIYDRLRSMNPRALLDKPIYISSVCISPRYRGQGYGSKLFETLMAVVRANFILEVAKDNDVAIRLYRKYGFKLMGQNDNTYLLKKFA